MAIPGRPIILIQVTWHTELWKGVVKSEVGYRISRCFFLSSATHVWVSVRSLLTNLCYSPNLALTLMSAYMRGVRDHICSYMSRRDAEKKWMAHI